MSNVFGRSSRVKVEEKAQAAAKLRRGFRRGRYYGLALLLVAAAATVRGALPEVLGPTPFLAFYLAWVGAAAFGGLGPGLLATAASWLCVDMLFDSTPWQTTFGDPATLGRMVFLLAGGTAVSLITERMRRGRILERRQAHEVARAKQEWERTFDAVPDLISIIDLQYRILRVNRAMAERLGVPPEQCIGLTCYQCVHDLNAPPALCPHTQCLADGREHTAEVYEERSGGHFLVTCTPLFDPNGQWIGSVHVARDITERKRAEEDLKRSESILAQAGEVAHLGAWEIEFTGSGDVNQNPLRWSDEVYRIFGYAPHSVAVSNDLFFRHVHPEDRRRVADAVAQAIREKHSYQIEHRIVRSDGAERIVLEHAEIKFDDQGRPRQMIGAVQDITERRQADQALRESEERLRAIFDNAGVGLAEAADDRLVAVNDRFCQILGYARAELLGKTVHELTAPDDRATSDVLNAQLREGRIDRLDYEKRYLQRDGTPLWAHVTVSAIHDADGRRHRGIATVEDISQRKRMEETLRESAAGLAAAQRLAHIGSWQWNIAADTALWSEETFRIFGLARGPLQQHREDFLSRIVPEDRQRVDQALSDALSGAGDYDLDYRIRLPDGRERVIHAQAQVLRGSDGRPVTMHGTVQDITERKWVEEALRELNATLETKVAQRTAELEQRARQLQRLTLELSEAEDRERRRLAEILHDDLQQTLAAAKFQLGRLRSRAQRDPAQQTAAAQVEHLLIEAIAKSRSLSHELSPAVLRDGDFGETLRWLANQVQAKHGLVVHVQASGPIDLQSDALKAFLYKASQETLFNVVKHAGVNEARIRVRRRGRYVGLSVSDRGRGFDPRDLKAAAGFGLLSIRERVELLGGRLKIRSAKGKGSAFFLIVPDAEAVVGSRTSVVREEQEKEPADHRLPTAGYRLPLRVLLADDHEIVRQGLISVLSEEHGIEIVGQAGNGREAVELACRLEPDVVVMDVSMPVMAGEEATRRIKRHRPQTRVIALSMHDEAQVRKRMRSAGATAYLLKTAPSEELLAAIREN